MCIKLTVNFKKKIIDAEWWTVQTIGDVTASSSLVSSNLTFPCAEQDENVATECKLRDSHFQHGRLNQTDSLLTFSFQCPLHPAELKFDFEFFDKLSLGVFEPNIKSIFPFFRGIKLFLEYQQFKGSLVSVMIMCQWQNEWNRLFPLNRLRRNWWNFSISSWPYDRILHDRL